MKEIPDAVEMVRYHSFSCHWLIYLLVYVDKGLILPYVTVVPIVSNFNEYKWIFDKALSGIQWKYQFSKIHFSCIIVYQHVQRDTCWHVRCSESWKLYVIEFPPFAPSISILIWYRIIKSTIAELSIWLLIYIIKFILLFLSE